MFNLQTQKNQCNGAFSPAIAIFFKGHKKRYTGCSPLKASPVIQEGHEVNTPDRPGTKEIGHPSGKDGLKPPLSVMNDTSTGPFPFGEELKFFAKLRFFLVVSSMTAIITIISVMIAG